MRSLFGLRAAVAAVALCCGAGLSAQIFYDSPRGFSAGETQLATPPAGTAPGGAAMSSAYADAVYYWDGQNIRRFDLASSVPAGGALFNVPVGAFGPYIDDLVFDPANPNDLFFCDSGGSFSGSSLYKLTLSGPDTVGASSTAGSSIFFYDMAFDGAGNLLATGADGAAYTRHLYVIDTATLAATVIADIPQAVNGSGPLAVDSAGNVFTAIASPYGSTGPGQILRFEAGDIATAVASGGVTVLDALTDATLVVDPDDGFLNPGHMEFRAEDGRDILWFTASGAGSLYRADLSTGQAWLFAEGLFESDQAGGYFSGASSLVMEDPSADFSPLGGGTSRIVAINGLQTPASGWSYAYYALTVFTPGAAPTAPAGLSITQAPSSISNGKPFSLTVEMRDGSSNLLTYDASVRVSVNGTPAGEIAGLTTQISDLYNYGVATLEDLVYTAPSGALPETVTFHVEFVGAAVSTDTGSISVVAPATQLAAVTVPSSAYRGQAFSVVAQIRDASSTLVANGTDASLAVTVALASGTGTLGGTTTVQASGGIASFTNLTVDASGTITLALSASGVTGVTTAAINIFVPAAALRVLSSPSVAQVDEEFSLTVEIVDSSGLRVDTGPDASLSISVSASGGGLGGTTTATASNGVASFKNLRIDDEGTYTLSVNATGLTGDVSDSFEVLLPELDDTRGCSAAPGGEPAALLAALGLLAAALHLRRRRA